MYNQGTERWKQHKLGTFDCENVCYCLAQHLCVSCKGCALWASVWVFWRQSHTTHSPMNDFISIMRDIKCAFKCLVYFICVLIMALSALHFSPSFSSSQFTQALECACYFSLDSIEIFPLVGRYGSDFDRVIIIIIIIMMIESAHAHKTSFNSFLIENWRKSLVIFGYNHFFSHSSTLSFYFHLMCSIWSGSRAINHD